MNAQPAVRVPQADLVPVWRVFLQTIDAAQRRSEPLASLQQVRRTCLDRLDQQWATLRQVAFGGAIPRIGPLLACLLQEWAIKEALDVVIRFHGSVVDPNDIGLQEAFWHKLLREELTLAAELEQLFRQGEQERAEAEERRLRERAEAEERRQRDWQRIAFEFQQEQRLFWREDHHLAQDWAALAQEQAEQTREAGELLLKTATRLTDAAVDMTKSTASYQEAFVATSKRRWGLGCLLDFLIVALVVAGIVYLLIHML